MKLSPAAVDQFRRQVQGDGAALVALSIIEGANEMIERLETYKATSPDDVRRITMKVTDIIELAAASGAPLFAMEIEAALAKAVGGGGGH